MKNQTKTAVVLTEEQKRSVAIARLAAACGVTLTAQHARLPDSDVLNYIAQQVESNN